MIYASILVKCLKTKKKCQFSYGSIQDIFYFDFIIISPNQKYKFAHNKTAPSRKEIKIAKERTALKDLKAFYDSESHLSNKKSLYNDFHNIQVKFLKMKNYMKYKNNIIKKVIGFEEQYLK